MVLWCSGYHICLTRRWSRVRTSPEPVFFMSVYIHTIITMYREWEWYINIVGILFYLFFLLGCVWYYYCRTSMWVWFCGVVVITIHFIWYDRCFGWTCYMCVDLLKLLLHKNINGINLAKPVCVLGSMNHYWQICSQHNWIVISWDGFELKNKSFIIIVHINLSHATEVLWCSGYQHTVSSNLTRIM